MRVVIAIEAHFWVVNGQAYSSYLTFERFWWRYREVFDSVLIIARATEVAQVPSGHQLITKNGVKLAALPKYKGPYQFLRKRLHIRKIIRNALHPEDAVILRAPGLVSMSVWKILPKSTPYAVEVIADPWDALSPGSVMTSLRPVFRWKLTRDLVRICRHASAATYVTEHALQKRYPPGGWSTYYSDVELSDDEIVDGSALEARFKRVKAKAQSGQPWRLCYVGTLGQLYKAPDVLINAVASCINNGLKLELTMVGDGQFQPQLEEQAQKLGIGEYVRFTGRLPAGKAVFDQFDKADLFVLPSRQEGLPRTMVEAMARGVPGIGSTVGGIPELLAAEDLVIPGDVQSLACKIREVLGNEKRLKEMSRRNLETVRRKFSPDELHQRWVNYYKKVAEISTGACS